MQSPKVDHYQDDLHIVSVLMIVQLKYYSTHKLNHKNHQYLAFKYLQLSIGYSLKVLRSHMG